MKFNKLLPAVLALSTMVAGGAFAHGDEEHAARKFDASKVEPTAFGQEGNPKKVARTIKVGHDRQHALHAIGRHRQAR